MSLARWTSQGSAKQHHVQPATWSAETNGRLAAVAAVLWKAVVTSLACSGRGSSADDFGLAWMAKLVWALPQILDQGIGLGAAMRLSQMLLLLASEV